MNKISKALFNQIQTWLTLKSAESKNYFWKCDVAPRRGDKNMKLYINKQTNRLSILKSFDFNENKANMVSLLVHDCMVPIIIDSENVNKFNNIFVKDNVRDIFETNFYPVWY